MLASLAQGGAEPELREELESLLNPGETVSEFVETAVLRAVRFRRERRHFHGRGEAAWRSYQRTGLSVPAGDVLASLQAKLDACRQ
ncbi:MAG TPA: YlcI/YnfO family protein [Burkholderiaceae bacterium]|nr:YlcI/YnfO family protein [Burkholderiaceae bacterium]